ncbi:MAG: hypothetical protein V1904_12275 [Bacteroidota bacterium]
MHTLFNIHHSLFIIRYSKWHSLTYITTVIGGGFLYYNRKSYHSLMPCNGFHPYKLKRYPAEVPVKVQRKPLQLQETGIGYRAFIYSLSFFF